MHIHRQHRTNHIGTLSPASSHALKLVGGSDADEPHLRAQTDPSRIALDVYKSPEDGCRDVIVTGSDSSIAL